MLNDQPNSGQGKSYIGRHRSVGRLCNTILALSTQGRRSRPRPFPLQRGVLRICCPSLWLPPYQVSQALGFDFSFELKEAALSSRLFVISTAYWQT